MANNLSVGLSKNIQADILNTNSALTATLRTGDIKTVSKLLSPLSFDEVPTSRFLGLSMSNITIDISYNFIRLQGPCCMFILSTSLSLFDNIIGRVQTQNSNSAYFVLQTINCLGWTGGRNTNTTCMSTIR